ncbi:hypothetical protein EYZ11_008514 [Aspergillus tanneri]|uniref:Uncharacterized protein n=1 Tax=Aspergillus tanneri TaxID=1220188 RepID=A0A4S3JAP9_9EURO|nr:uncharacterized protein ATNIH1004_002866 [Aspergillus tanneri]KAA8650185.1 hypothetical protein ATNIH1004_002866 [Aspergillus tanneri]THC92015.1 hypothetical protein EYZ11_008514 [Aspergillus tanneri]
MALLAIFLLSTLCLAQLQDFTHSQWKIPGASLSFKQTNLCTSPYTGHIHLPPNPTSAFPHPSNIYFFYTPSQHDPSTTPDHLPWWRTRRKFHLVDVLRGRTTSH